MQKVWCLEILYFQSKIRVEQTDFKIFKCVIPKIAFFNSISSRTRTIFIRSPWNFNGIRKTKLSTEVSRIFSIRWKWFELKGIFHLYYCFHHIIFYRTVRYFQASITPSFLNIIKLKNKSEFFIPTYKINLYNPILKTVIQYREKYSQILSSISTRYIDVKSLSVPSVGAERDKGCWMH